MASRTSYVDQIVDFARRRVVGDPSAQNAMIHGDNLAALAWMEAKFRGRFRCVYLDPPFNTGRRFAEYEDAKDRRAWRAMMHARIRAMHPLVADDGALLAEIDDTELGSLLDVLDDVFGAKNRVSTVTVVRSAPTGHKAQNRGPVNTTDYLLIYAKHKEKWRAFPQVRARKTYDAAYGTFIPNVREAPSAWRFLPLARAFTEARGYETSLVARRSMGRDAFTGALERFAVEHADHVIRFAQPRYEAVSQTARAWIDRSRRAPSRVLLLERSGYSPMFLRGGNRILFLSDKVRTVRGARVLVEPLTNVWDDVPFQGIAREGGVVFSRNKKPERLIARILAMTTEAGDWVLDPFLGSGTTAAVAHKMGRRWVGIDSGQHLLDLAFPRLCRVVDGEDASGVSAEYGWTGGGGFSLHT